MIHDELNVHEVHFVQSAEEYVTYNVKPNFKLLGPRVGKRMPALKKALAEADGAALLAQLGDSGSVQIRVDGESIELGPDEIAVNLVAREGFSAASGSPGVIVLRTSLTPELIDEGLYREVLNRVQAFRKALDLEYAGRIRLTLSGAPELMNAIRPRTEDLGRETLAIEVALETEPLAGAHTTNSSIDGHDLTLGLTLA